MHTLNEPIYYNKGARRRLVSYCIDCKNTAFAGGCVIVADYKYFGYYEILDAIRDSKERAIIFEEAVRRAFYRTQNVSYNGSGAEPGVSMLKRYLGYHFHKDIARENNTSNNQYYQNSTLLKAAGPVLKTVRQK